MEKFAAWQAYKSPSCLPQSDAKVKNVSLVPLSAADIVASLGNPAPDPKLFSSVVAEFAFGGPDDRSIACIEG
jgi:hypothetical protein